MILYGKVINEETGICEVGTGTNIEFYKSIGYVELEVKQSDVDGCYYLTEKCPMKSDKEKAEEEAERIALLHLTKREVFLGLYNAKQVTPDQIKAQITEPAALIEFEYATEYYRGNPLIDMVGQSLGLSKEALDKFFEYNDYRYLLEEEEKPNENTTDTNPTPVHDEV